MPKRKDDHDSPHDAKKIKNALFAAPTLEKEKRFACDLCPARFGYSGDLIKHRRVHTGERPFRCEHVGCGASFANSSNLVVHRRSHTGERPYPCEYAGCDMAFPSTTDLNKHRRVHTNEKPFQCPTCQNHFSDRSALRVHLQLHEDRDRFECPEPGCRMTFASELKLDRHRRQEHGLTSHIAPVPAFALPPTAAVALTHAQPVMPPMPPMPSLHQLQQFMYTDHGPMLNSAAQAALAAALATAETNPLALAHSAAEVVSSVQPNLQLPGLNAFASSGYPSAISPSSLNSGATMSQEHPSELMQSVVSAVQHLLAFPTNKAPAHSQMHFQPMHAMPAPQQTLVPNRQTQRPSASFVTDNAAANLMSTLTDLLPRSASPATLASLQNALAAVMNGTSNQQ